MSRHTYPEYLYDLRTAFDEVAGKNGLTFKQIGTMPGYQNGQFTLYFGIEAGQPAPYLKIGNHPVMTGEAVLQAAGLPTVGAPARVNSDRELTVFLLEEWARVLSTLLPDLAAGRTQRLNLPSVEEVAYEQRLRTFIHNNAPIGHIARTRLWETDWRKHAENFLRETGKTLD